MEYTDKRYFMFRYVSDYTPTDESEATSKQKILELLTNYPNCFDRPNLPGHITGSALVVNEDITHVLLTHHKKIGKWFQFGGHSEGDNNTFYVCMREAFEESGLKSIHLISEHLGIFDIDVHHIDAKPDMPEHYHHDIRMILAADMNEPFIVSSESIELKWIELDKVSEFNNQPAFLRLINKAKSLKAAL